MQNPRITGYGRRLRRGRDMEEIEIGVAEEAKQEIKMTIAKKEENWKVD